MALSVVLSSCLAMGNLLNAQVLHCPFSISVLSIFWTVTINYCKFYMYNVFFPSPSSLFARKSTYNWLNFYIVPLYCPSKFSSWCDATIHATSYLTFSYSGRFFSTDWFLLHSYADRCPILYSALMF